MFLCMIGRTDQRTAFHNFKSFRESCFFIGLELFRSDIFRHRIMVPAGLQILADSQDLATVCQQIIHGFFYFLNRFSKSDHNS